MNTTQHLFLHSPPAALPARWAEAFAAGRLLETAALLAWLRGHSIVFDIVWLSTTDAQWLAHLQQIVAAEPAARVVVLSAAPQPQEGLIAINAGARGYTHTHAVPALLKEVALVVEHGGLWVGPELLRRLVSSTSAALASRAPPATPPSAAHDAALASLSAREAEVAHAVLAGCSNREVAELMHISERTVKAHLGVVFEKMGVRDRLQLALRLSAAASS
jgi:DNA-binding NarL/FixJ family response regulator